MSPSRASAMALHVDAAKRLLRELEQHALSASEALDRGAVTEFIAAIDDRDRILNQLTHVVGAIAHERGTSTDVDKPDINTAAMFAEMTRAAAAALETQQQLTARAMRERNRLASALHATNRPDAVAGHYAVAAGEKRRVTLSVTG
jgi:hypothetical protein